VIDVKIGEMRGGSWMGWRRNRRRRRDACVHLVRRELGDAGNRPLAASHLFPTGCSRVQLIFVFRFTIEFFRHCIVKWRCFQDLSALEFILHIFI
jgi:hypothetical protein